MKNTLNYKDLNLKTKTYSCFPERDGILKLFKNISNFSQTEIKNIERLIDNSIFADNATDYYQNAKREKSILTIEKAVIKPVITTIILS